MSSSTPRPDRVTVLASRVRWLDRYRRAVAVALALGAFFFIYYGLESPLGSQWSNVVGTIISLMVAVTSWWIIEVALAWVTALWETEHDNILRDRGLPRAELIVRRKK